MTTFIDCKAQHCLRRWEVSEEDPDATMSEFFEHAETKHPGEDPAKLMRVEEAR